MTTVKQDNDEWTFIVHDGVSFMFEKLDDETVDYRFARTALGRPSANLTDQFDRSDIPQAVIETLTDLGYEHD